MFGQEAKKGSNMDKQSLQLLLGKGISVERIAKRFGKDPSTVSYWLKKHGLESPYREKHAPKGGIERDRLVSSSRPECRSPESRLRWVVAKAP
jgi:transposase-like protein